MTTIEQVLETVDTLSLAERRRLLQHLQQAPERPELADAERAEKLRRELDEYQRAKQWIAAHRAEYLGQWVALEGDRLISHGFDGHQVVAEARAAGIDVPFLVQISEEPAAYCGAWL